MGEEGGAWGEQGGEHEANVCSAALRREWGAQGEGGHLVRDGTMEGVAAAGLHLNST